MRKGVHASQQGRVKSKSIMSQTVVITASIVCLAAGNALARPQEAVAQPLPVVEAPGREQVQAQEALQPESRHRLLNAGRRNVLARLMEQLQEQSRETEELLGHNDRADRRGQILQAELRALGDLTRMVERELDGLSSEGAEAAADRQRRRGNEILEQQAREPEPMAGRTTRLIRRLQELRGSAEQMEQALDQVQDQDSEEAQEMRGALEEACEEIEIIQDQLEAQEREAAQREEQERASYLHQLGRQQGEIRENMEMVRRQLQEIREQREREDGRWEQVYHNLLGLTEQAHATRDELARRRDEQHEAARHREDLMHQQEELRDQIGRLGEYFHIAAERAGEQSEEYHRQLEQLRTDLHRMGRTIGQMEQDRVRTQEATENNIQQLHEQVRQLRQEIIRVRSTLSMLLSQTEGSTVGSAGRSWSW